MTPDNEWTRRYLKPIKGAKIEDVGCSEEGFPRLIVRTKENEVFTLEVSKDQEGNGPGFIFGLPQP